MSATHQRSQPGLISSRKWILGLAACLILAVSVVLVIVLTRTTIKPAPGVAALPIAPHAHLIAQVAGPSNLSSAIPRRYRYLAIAGTAGQSRRSLITAEVAAMRREGWKLQSSDKSFGEREWQTRSVPVTTPGAEVILDSHYGSIYAALYVARTVYEANQINDGTRLYGNSRITRAFGRRRRPVLLVTLGNNIR